MTVVSIVVLVIMWEALRYNFIGTDVFISIIMLILASFGIGGFAYSAGVGKGKAETFQMALNAQREHIQGLTAFVDGQKMQIEALTKKGNK